MGGGNSLYKGRRQEGAGYIREPSGGGKPSGRGVSVSCEWEGVSSESSVRTCHSAEEFGFHPQNDGEPLANFRQQRSMNSLINTAPCGP